MLPIKVHSWNEIPPADKDKLWKAIADNFEGEGGLEHRRASIMKSARTTWNKWRGAMNQLHLKHVSNLDEALSPENIPASLLKEDCDWLVIEHYLDPDFIGGKEGKEPSLTDVFRRTRRMKDGGLAEDSAKKYDKIQDESAKNPTTSTIDMVDTYFGFQGKGRVVCFGEGMTPRDFRGPLPSKADLRAELQEKNQVIAKMKDQLANVENRDEVHQKKVTNMEASHQRAMDAVYNEIQMLKDLFVNGRQSAGSPSS